MTAAAIVDFKIFKGWNVQEGQTASLTVRNFVEIDPTATVIFWFYKMAAAAILDFWNFKFLTVMTVKRVELCYCAKFCRSRPKRGRDIAIYRFFKMADAAILDFKNFKFLKCIIVPNFVEIARNAAEICKFKYYVSLAWKWLFTPLFGEFLGHISPNWCHSSS